MRRVQAGHEAGTITVMTIGFLLFLGLLTVVVVNSSAAFLQRQRLDNLADGAARSAADGLSRDVFYREGTVKLDGSQARRLVGDYVGGPGIRIAWVRTQDDRVQVRLERTVDLAIAPPGWQTRTTIVSEGTAELRTADWALDVDDREHAPRVIDALTPLSEARTLD